jgi:UPF0716 protein FxsA
MLRLRLHPVLIALFVGLPLLDAMTLVLLGRFLGFWQTVAIVLVSGFCGATLAKQQGLRVLRSVQADLAAGRAPAEGLVDGVLILVASGMLIAPGFLTDLIGLSLLLPAVRVPIKRVLRRRFESAVMRRFQVGP